MKSRVIFLVVMIAAVVVGGGALFMVSRQNKPTASFADIQPSPSPIIELTLWKDQSEYSFQYPKDLTLDPHDEDQQKNSHVELTSKAHSGSIIIWTKDTTAKDIEAWVKQQKLTSALDSTLGQQPAKKVLDGENNKFTITTIRDGYLYQVEASLIDAEFWNNILDTVISSYAFTGNMSEVGGRTVQTVPVTDTSSSDVEFEGEEVIE